MSTAKTMINTPEGKSFQIDVQEWRNFEQNYKQIYQHLMSEIGDDERINYFIFGYDDNSGGVTIMIYTNRCTLYKLDGNIFNQDHSNDREVTNKFIAAWRALPEEESDKDQYEGFFHGHKIKFNREFAKYYFSDDECERLLNGDTIHFITEQANGDLIGYRGSLQMDEYKGFTYFGFKSAGFALKQKVRGVTLTREQMEKLLNGEEVQINDMVNKQGKHYSAIMTFNPKKHLEVVKFIR